MFEDLKKSFNEDGFVVVRDLFDSSEIKFYREVIKEAIKERKHFDKRVLQDRSEYESHLLNVKIYGKII